MLETVTAPDAGFTDPMSGVMLALSAPEIVQLKVEDSPLLTAVGFALKAIAGGPTIDGSKTAVR